MSREHHHGVDTLEIERGTRPVKTGKSSVIGLVGTAPKGPGQYPDPVPVGRGCGAVWR